MLNNSFANRFFQNQKLITYVYYFLNITFVLLMVLFNVHDIMSMGFVMFIGLCIALIYPIRKHHLYQKLASITIFILAVRIFIMLYHLLLVQYIFLLIFIPIFFLFLFNELQLVILDILTILIIFFNKDIAMLNEQIQMILFLISLFIIVISFIIKLDQRIANDSRTQLAKINNILSYSNTHDSLTGLINKTSFSQLIQQAIERNRQDQFYLFALVNIDLDRFRVINTTYGLEIGDLVIKEVVKKIEQSLPLGNISRVGGDSFMFLIDDIYSLDQSIHILESILEDFRTPVSLAQHEIYVTGSFGVVTCQEQYDSPVTYFRSAEMAMYQAKSKGRNGYVLYNNYLEVLTDRRSHLEIDLKTAIEHNEFAMVFQPIIKLSTNSMCCLEALIRWNHPQYGLISPNEFIHLAEQTGLIIQLGEWVFEEVCKEIQLLNYQFSISFNLSPIQFKYPELINRFMTIIEKYSISPDIINIEITENAIIDDTGNAKKILERFKELGFKIHLDDFGIGYSSLGYLSQYPIDGIKIDKSFVQSLEKSKKNYFLVRSMIEMANSLNMLVVGEGIETPKQLTILQELGCQFGQGFYYSKPVSTQEVFIYINQAQ